MDTHQLSYFLLYYFIISCELGTVYLLDYSRRIDRTKCGNINNFEYIISSGILSGFNRQFNARLVQYNKPSSISESVCVAYICSDWKDFVKERNKLKALNVTWIWRFIHSSGLVWMISFNRIYKLQQLNNNSINEIAVERKTKVTFNFTAYYAFIFLLT